MPWFFKYALLILVPLFGVYFYNIRQILNAGEELWHWNRNSARRWIVLFSCAVNVLPLAALVAFWIGGREAARILSGDYRLVDYLVVYPFWFSLVAAVQTFLLLIAWHVVRTIIRSNNATWKKLQPRITIGIFVAGVIYSCLTIYINTWTIRGNERELKLPRRFAALDGTRIVLIADVQGDGRTSPEYIRRLVDKANALQPGIILFGGDVVTSGSEYVESTIDVLSNLNAQSAKIAVIGDHDMFSGKRPIVEGMVRAGFVVLEDSSMRMAVSRTPILVTGLVYTYRQRPSRDLLSQIIDTGNDSFKILLVHQPREELVHYASEKGYHLFAAGHTHGGAIAFGIPGIFLLAPSLFETKYFTGFYEVGGMLVSVTNGLGHTLAPIRFQAPAEITLIRLVAR
jgi:predicted MPP superfamily phosphohydrolase